MTVLLGYARVSTAEQNADLQTDELTSAGCYQVFVDDASGMLDRRPELDKVLERLRPGDTLVVWRLDRLGRSLRHLIDTVIALDERGVGFRSLRESDHHRRRAAGAPPVRCFGPVLERELIRDRTMAGLSAARARGRNGGRPSKLSADQVRAARRLYDEPEHTVEQIGSMFGVSRTSIPGVARQGGSGEAGCGWRGSGPAAFGVDVRFEGSDMTGPGERLVTVLLTLAVPAEADAEDAAGLVADAAASTALSLVVRYSGGQPWRVEAVHQGGATLADLSGTCVAAPLASLAPDPVQTAGAATSAAGSWGT